MSNDLVQAYYDAGVTIDSLVKDKVELYREIKNEDIEKMASLRNKMINEMVDNIVNKPIEQPKRPALPASSQEEINDDDGEEIFNQFKQIAEKLEDGGDEDEKNLALLNRIPQEISETEDYDG